MKRCMILTLIILLLIVLGACESRPEPQTVTITPYIKESPSYVLQAESMQPQSTGVSQVEPETSEQESAYITETPYTTESPSLASLPEPAKPQSTGVLQAESETSGDDNRMAGITISVGDSNFTAKLYDNDTATALLPRLPLTLNMSELNANEKYYNLPDKLPSDSRSIRNIKAGDLMLYGSNCLVLFYKDFPTSYSYTRLGYVEDTAGLADALGKGSVEVTFTVSY